MRVSQCQGISGQLASNYLLQAVPRLFRFLKMFVPVLMRFCPSEGLSLLKDAVWNFGWQPVLPRAVIERPIFMQLWLPILERHREDSYHEAAQAIQAIPLPMKLFRPVQWLSRSVCELVLVLFVWHVKPAHCSPGGRTHLSLQHVRPLAFSLGEHARGQRHIVP